MDFFDRSKTQPVAPLLPADPGLEALAAMQRGIAEATPRSRKAGAPSTAAATPVAPVFPPLGGAMDAGIAEATRVEKYPATPEIGLGDQPNHAHSDVRMPSLPEGRRAEYNGYTPKILEGAKNAPELIMVGDRSLTRGTKDALPQHIDDLLERGATGAFDSVANKAYVVGGMDEATTNLTAYHEIAGHYGLQGSLGEDYSVVMERAGYNPIVKVLADRMLADAYGNIKPEIDDLGNDWQRIRITEEALAELAAAQLTGDFGVIERDWGVKVPASSRPGLQGVIARVGQLTKRKLADLTGDEPHAYSNEQVYSMIKDAWRYVKRARPKGEAAAGTEAAAAMQLGIDEASVKPIAPPAPRTQAARPIGPVGLGDL